MKLTTKEVKEGKEVKEIRCWGSMVGGGPFGS
jgi:hypothetical protein